MENALKKPITWLLGFCLAVAIAALAATPAFATNYSNKSFTYDPVAGKVVIKFTTSSTMMGGTKWGFYFYDKQPQGLSGTNGAEKDMSLPENAQYNTYLYSYTEPMLKDGSHTISIDRVSVRGGGTVNLNELSGTFYVAAGPITPTQFVDCYMGSFTYVGKDSPEAKQRAVSGTVDAKYLPATVVLESGGKTYAATVDQTTGAWTANVPANATYTVTVTSDSGDYSGTGTVAVADSPVTDAPVTITETQQGKDKASFETGRQSKAAELAAQRQKLVDDGASQDVLGIIDAAIQDVDGYVYDTTKDLAANEKALTDIVSAMNADIALQQDKEAFAKYQADQAAAVAARHAADESAEVEALIDDAKAAVEAYAYDDAKTLAENKAAIDDIVGAMNAEVAKQQDKEAFAAYRDEQSEAAAALHADGESERIEKLINDAQGAIDASEFDDAKTLAENKAAIDEVLDGLKDALAFEAHRDAQAQAVAALHSDNESAETATLIDAALEALDNYAYDGALSLDKNMAAIDEIVARLNSELFEGYRAAKTDDVAALHVDGESDAVKKLIDDGLSAIAAYTYDPAKSLEENKAALDKLMVELVDAVEAQKAAEQIAADKEAFESYRAAKAEQAAAMHAKGESADMKALIDSYQKAIADYRYDEGKSLEENKAALDKLIGEMKAAVEKQKNKEAQDAKQAVNKAKSPKALAKTGDDAGAAAGFAFAAIAAAGAVGFGAYRKVRKAS